jgi:hypothetical protein
MKRPLYIVLLLLSQGAFAQEETVESIELLPATKHYYRPQFADTTLLFFSDSLVWTCAIGDGFNYSFYKVDFFKVTECECYKEIYQKLPALGNPNRKGSWDNYRYEVIRKEKHAELKRLSANLLEYTEFDRSENPIRTQKLTYDPNEIVFVDSVYAENADRELFLTVSRWVEVKNK